MVVLTQCNLNMEKRCLNEPKEISPQDSCLKNVRFEEWVKVSWAHKQISWGWYDWNSIHRKEVFNNLCGNRMYVDRKTPSDTDKEFSFLKGKWYRNLGKQIQWWHHMLSHGSITLPFPVESDSCGLIPGTSTPFAFILTPASSWRVSFWRLAPSPPANQEQVAGTSKPPPISEWCSLWDWGGEGHFRSISLGQVPAHLRPVHEISSPPLEQNLGSPASPVI